MASLITLSSPIAVMLPGGETRQVNIVQAEMQDAGGGELLLTVSRYFDSTEQQMRFVRNNDVPRTKSTVQVRVRATNVRSKQEVA